MFRTLSITAIVFATAGEAAAQPHVPYPRMPYPQVPVASPIEGVWYFRGDPSQPAYIRTVQTPAGPQVIATNEKGSSSPAELSPDGRRVFVYEWNIEGRLRGRRLVWPNGDFWAR